jgi:hypothetical protein
MGSVALVILACLAKEPSRCETFHLPFEEEMNAVSCVWRAQLRVAQWAGEHPDWSIQRFACELPEA